MPNLQGWCRRDPAWPAALAMTLAAAWQAAAAQPASPPQQVEVKASASAERREEVAGKQVIGAAELTRHGDTRLADALRRVPGLAVSGSGAELSIRLDGMAAEQTLVLLNGEPVPRQQVLEALALGSVERVEIVRGANVQWSGRGLAGTVNIVTQRQALRAQREFGLALGSHFGRPTGHAELTLADRDDATSWRLAFAARAERERYPADQEFRYADAAGRTLGAYRARLVEPARDEGLSITPMWQWSAADGRRLLAEAMVSASRYTGHADSAAEEPEGVPPRMQQSRLSYRHDRTLARLRLEAAWPLAAAAKLSGNLTATHGRRDQDAQLVGHDFTGRQVRDGTVESTRRDDVLSGRAALEHRLAAGHTLTAGLQLESNRARENRVQREHIPSWEPDLTDERYDASARSLAAYLQDDWLPERHTTVSLGARIEQLATRSEGNVFDGVRQRHRLASPVANLMWRPDGRTQWQLGLARAYRLPEPRDIMPRRWTRPENSSLVPDFFGNPDLRPESAWTLQLGWEQHAGGDGELRGGISALVKRIDDVVLRELVLANERYLLRPVNLGRAWMAQLQGRAQTGMAAPWGGVLTLKLGVTVRDSRIDALPGPDNRLAEQSRQELQLDAEHRGAAGSAWSFNAGWRWRSATRSQSLGGRVLARNPVRSIDLSALWQAGTHDRLRLAVTGLAAGDEDELVLRLAPEGSDRLHSKTQLAPRWRVQWLHRM